MAFALPPPICQYPPRRATCVCIVVLLLWSAFVLDAQADFRRAYKAKDISGDRLKDMADGVKRCAEWVGGKLPISDTVGKQDEIEYALDLYRAKKNLTHIIWVMLGGSVSVKGCNQSTRFLPGHCFWCWDYGTGNCGANNESLIGTGLYPNFTKYPGHYSNWEDGHPFLGDASPYMFYFNGARRFWPEAAGQATDLLCVVNEPITDSTGSSLSSLNLSLVEPTAAPSGSTKWWIPLIIVVGILVIIAIAITLVFCYCCGAGAPLEEEYKSEEDEPLPSVRDTRSNRSLVTRGDSMRTMGSRRSSTYSAS